MRRGMILLGFWMCVCMVFLVNAQEHTSRKLYCTDEDRAIFDRYCTQMEPKKSLPLDELMIHTALFFRGNVGSEYDDLWSGRRCHSIHRNQNH